MKQHLLSKASKVFRSYCQPPPIIDLGIGLKRRKRTLRHNRNVTKVLNAVFARR